MKYNHIIIDAMGGDHAPNEVIKGAVAACEESETIRCTFVGSKPKIVALLEQLKLSRERWSVIHTDEFVTMKDDPKSVLKEKEKASINIATELIKNHVGDALVSAGNTGATILACSNHIPLIPGIERGILAAILPADKINDDDPGFCIMLDVGATLHCTVTQLVSFALMGNEYARSIFSLNKPRIGLLNIGEEDTKGHDILIETHKRLKGIQEVNFIGNVEGKDLLRGGVDVIITEGYIGNITLKCIEGMAEMMITTVKKLWKRSLLIKLGFLLMAPSLKGFKKRVDYSEYGGAPILGFQKLIIKAHGRSKAKAIKNAILLAEKSIESNLTEHMEKSMKNYYLHLFDH
ncbi:phosphate acyltransferase PlsX [candidate division KSB1 bacterium]|nr:phosphate acyltransferase PlsX [candidate division KSB1 bacterium]